MSHAEECLNGKTEMILKILAYLLIALGVIIGSVSGYMFFHHKRDALTAIKMQKAAIQEAENWEFADRLQRQHLMMEYTTDQKRIENDNLEIEIARLQGKSTVKAEAKLSRSQELLRSDEQAIDLMNQSEVFGPSPNVMKSQEKAEQAKNRYLVDQTWIQREEKAAWFAVALLICSGFAFGFSTLQRTTVANA